MISITEQLLLCYSVTSLLKKKIAYLSSRLLRKCARLVQFKRFLKKIETATHMSCDAKSLSPYERYFKQFTRLIRS